jgi:hypothetical protein
MAATTWYIASNASDVVVEGIGLNNGGGNLLLNDVTVPSTIITSPNLAFYALGHSFTGTSGTVAPNVITSDPTVASEFNAHLGGNTDVAGACTLGSFSPGSCQVGFVNNYNSKPVCTANSEGSTNALKVVTAINGLQITSSSSADTSIVGYICIGNPN